MTQETWNMELNVSAGPRARVGTTYGTTQKRHHTYLIRPMRYSAGVLYVLKDKEICPASG